MPGGHRGFHEIPRQGVTPAHWYTQGEPFQHERKTLFACAWQLLGRDASLREPGDYICANLAGWPVFALVNGKNELHAFRNVCSHQQMAGAGRCQPTAERQAKAVGRKLVPRPPTTAGYG